VATIQRNADRLEALILELRTLAEVALDTPPRERASGDLELLCAEVQDMWTPQFQERGVRLSLLASGPVLYEGLDKQRVVGALSRLIENALQASREGDAVLLRVSRQDDRGFVEVLDEGAGLRTRPTWRSSSRPCGAGERSREVSGRPVRRARDHPVHGRRGAHPSKGRGRSARNRRSSTARPLTTGKRQGGE
jgi:hypothetical protein